nr:histidine kinase dimerization/phosphoacceptor domain-containing protein [Jiangella alkaliphila]
MPDQVWVVPLGVATVVVAGVALWWPRSRAWLPWGTAAAGVVSLATTVAHLAGPWPGSPPWGMVELLLLSVLVGACARWAPVRAAVPAAVVAGLGGATSLLRATDDGGSGDLTTLEAVYAVSFWALAPIVAAGAGLLLRHQHERRVRAVAAGRRAQRLELARDLHDYVAHDVSEMIAQAQAAGTVAPPGTPAGDALRQIEAAGLRAMASMDRTVQVLSGGDDGSGSSTGADDAVRPQPGLADLPALVERFAASGPAPGCGSTPRVTWPRRCPARSAARHTGWSSRRSPTSAGTPPARPPSRCGCAGAMANWRSR